MSVIENFMFYAFFYNMQNLSQNRKVFRFSKPYYVYLFSDNVVFHLFDVHLYHLPREAAKNQKNSSLANKALPPPPLSLVVTFFPDFFSSFKKSSFFLVARPFFVASLKRCRNLL